MTVLAYRRKKTTAASYRNGRSRHSNSYRDQPPTNIRAELRPMDEARSRRCGAKASRLIEAPELEHYHDCRTLNSAEHSFADVPHSACSLARDARQTANAYPEATVSSAAANAAAKPGASCRILRMF